MSPLPRPAWRDLALLIAGYVVLDWASYFHPLHGLNITPWSPGPALGLVYLLRHGRHAAPALLLAILVADAGVRGLPISLPGTLLLPALLVLGYWAIAETLRRRLGGIGLFASRRGLIEWALILALGTCVNSLIFVGALALGGLIPVDGLREAFIRYWVGDGVGAIVTMPLLWLLLDPAGRTRLRAIGTRRAAAAFLAATAAALGIAFGPGAGFQYFYVLFIPVAWAAARHGLTGAVLAAGIVQVGIIGAVQLLGLSAVTVLQIQVLALVLALFGFFIGIVVDEREQLSAELRQTLRLAAAGEMAGALAHELNQPLTALAAYGTACEHLLAQGETGERLRDSIRRMVSESQRAADVVRRLRDFFRTGATRLESFPLAALFTTMEAGFAPRAARDGVALHLAPPPPCHLFADRLQLEVVLRNLLANAFDAVAGEPPEHRRIDVAAELEDGGQVVIRVEDSGPGPAPGRLFEAFRSTKASGLGLGLAISRAIAEAHGGSLHAEAAGHGCFRLTLPIEGVPADAG